MPSGLVEAPQDFTLADLKAMPKQEQITTDFCIQGWSGVAKWGGTSMHHILNMQRPTSHAGIVKEILYCVLRRPSGEVAIELIHDSLRAKGGSSGCEPSLLTCFDSAHWDDAVRGEPSRIGAIGPC
jgi:hypothetical protein